MSTEAKATIEPNETVGHFINGRMVADNARTQDVYNPAIGRAVRQVALASKATPPMNVPQIPSICIRIIEAVAGKEWQ